MAALKRLPLGLIATAAACVVVVVLLIAVLGGGSDEGDKGSVNVTADSGPVEKARLPEKPRGLEETVALGEPLRFPGQMELAITAVKRSRELTPRADAARSVLARGEFLILEVRATNLTDERQTFDDSLIAVEDGKGEIYRARRGQGIYQIGNLAGLIDERKLQPDATLVGRLAFDVPVGADIRRARVAEEIDYIDAIDGPYSHVELR